MRLDRTVLLGLATSVRFERAVRVVPGGAVLAWRAAARYVAGPTSAQALATAADLTARGHGVSIDLFGEQVTDPAAADRVVAAYQELATTPALGPAWLSVDLTHLALDVDPAGAAARLTAIVDALPAGARVQVGAEDAGRADAVLACVLDVAGRSRAHRVGATVSANLQRSAADVDAMAAAGVHVRLVKGAYRAGSGALRLGEPTDVAFLRLAHRLSGHGADWAMATHDGRLREALLLALGPIPVEQLLGVRPGELAGLHARGVPTRVYVPYGADWFRYWMRRVAESRGA